MLGEMRNALLLQRVKYGSDSLSARDVFSMASQNGAKMLSFGNLGKLEPGWGADIAAFDVSGLEYAGSQTDPVASLLFCGTKHETKYTIINGEWVVYDGHLRGWDEAELAEKGREASRKLLSK